MWLKQMVGIIVVTALLIMNGVIAAGLFIFKAPEAENAGTTSLVPAESVLPPTVTLEATPGTVGAKTPSALNWSTTNNPSTCVASGDWAGNKTQFGAESTGRLNDLKTYTYTITCENSAGKAEATVKVDVTAAAIAQSDATKKATASSTPSPSPSGPTYCSGRIPCYGPNDVSSHNASGNCWGYNGDRVMNISNFDSAYHQAKSGIGSIQVGSVCGSNLASALRGDISVDGQTRDHNQSTKSNSEKNMIPYFVGYFDASK